MTPSSPLPFLSLEYGCSSRRRAAWVLLFLCVFTLVPFLGETLFNTRGEPREAVVALSMLQDGNWVLPVNNGIDMAYKPPFYHWLVAIVSLPLGHVTEFTSRLPSALALASLVLATFCFYSRRLGTSVAFLASLLFLTSFEVHRAGVACRVDMLLTATTVIALYLLCRWADRGWRGVPLLAVLALSGAFLSKGPVGAALPCLVIAVYGWARGDGFWRVLWRVAVCGLLSSVLPLVWYYLAWQQGGRRFLDLVYEENVLRLLGRMSYESHVNPWYYNVVTLLSGFLPYTLLVLLSLFVLRWRCPVPVGQWWGTLRVRLRGMDRTRLFTLVSFLVIFVFYCIPKSKRSVYLLPVYPFLACFLAEYVLWLARRHHLLLRRYGRLLLGLSFLLPLVFLALRLGLVPDSVCGHGRHAAANVAMLTALRTVPVGLAGWVGLAAPFVAAVLYFRWSAYKVSDAAGTAVSGAFRRAVAIVAVVIGVFLSLDALYQPLVLNTKSDKPIADEIARLAPTGRVYSYRAQYTPGNPLHPFTVNFYLGDRVVPFHAFLPASGYLIVSGNSIGRFRQTYPDYRVRLVRDFGRRSCDDRAPVSLYWVGTP